MPLTFNLKPTTTCIYTYKRIYEYIHNTCIGIIYLTNPWQWYNGYMNECKMSDRREKSNSYKHTRTHTHVGNIAIIDWQTLVEPSRFSENNCQYPAK